MDVLASGAVTDTVATDAAEDLRTLTAQDAARLRTRNRTLEIMLAAVPVGIVVADKTGRIVSGNLRVEEMVGHPVIYSKDADDYGEWIAYHANGQRVQSLEYPLARIVVDGEDYAELDVHYQRGDGTLFWMRIIGRPILDTSGNRVGATVALIDIDETVKLSEQRQILIDELDHRVKNAFTVMKSIVRNSLRRTDVSPEVRDTLDERLAAYARAHASLNARDLSIRDLRRVVEDVLGHQSRIRMDGPELTLPARPALALSMALYELMTNATKHGALSVDGGHVDLVWSLANDELSMRWTEVGGPRVDFDPHAGEHGFGSFVIDRALAGQTRGRVEQDFAPEGLRWIFTMPLEGLA